jgi:hypothetical protein
MPVVEPNLCDLLCLVGNKAKDPLEFRGVYPTSKRLLEHLQPLVLAYLTEARKMTTCACSLLACTCPLPRAVAHFLLLWEPYWVLRFRALLRRMPDFAYDKRTRITVYVPWTSTLDSRLTERLEEQVGAVALEGREEHLQSLRRLIELTIEKKFREQ